MKTNEEFEEFLRAISGALRLSDEHRRTILDELAGHLEDQLEDFLQQGMKPPQAVRRALDEFGDASKLALDFVELAKRRSRRRWTMRITAVGFSLAVCGVMAILVYLPDEMVTRAVTAAQEPSLTARGTADGLDRTRETERRLGQRVPVQFVDTPLAEALQFFGEAADIDFYVSRQALAENGLDTDVPVNLSLKQVRIDMALDLVLSQVDGLAYAIRDGIVMISTVDEIELLSELRVYNCRDLLEMQAARGSQSSTSPFGQPGAHDGGDGYAGEGGHNPYGPSGADGGSGAGAMSGSGGGGPMSPSPSPASALIQLVESTVSKDSWESVGGFGSIAEYGGMLVVNNTPKVHRQIEQLFSMLRENLDRGAGSRGRASAAASPLGGGDAATSRSADAKGNPFGSPAKPAGDPFGN